MLFANRGQLARRRTRATSSPAFAGSQSNGDRLALLRRHKPDHWLIVLCAILLATGLMVIYSISPALAQTSGVSGSYYVERQILAIVLAAIAFFVTASIPLERWRRSYKLLLGFAILATLVAIALPVNPNYPAHRWVRLGSLSFESVDLLIFALLIWAANFLAIRLKNGTINNFKKTAYPLLIVMLVVGFVVAVTQSDLGSTGVIVVMLGLMAYVAGLPLKRIFIFGGIIALGTFLAIIATPYRRARLETFLHPDTNCQTTGYQACQSIIAVGSGGFTGLGLGSSVQAYGYLPEADNDSIFAIFAEKFGFIGSALLLLVFGALFYRIAKIGERAPDDFSRLIVFGVLIWISVETVINIGAMIGLLPLKGITLPFVSYGGTSVVFFATSMGLVYQISRYGSHVGPDRDRLKLMERISGNDYSGHRRRFGGAHNPGFGGRGRTKEA